MPIRLQSGAKWVLVVVLGLILLWQIGRLPASMPVNDFVEYWGAARVLLSGGNPYSPEQLLQAEAQARSAPDGREQSPESSVSHGRKTPLLLWAPPWTITFSLPLARLEYGSAATLWLFVGLALTLGCGDLAWKLYAERTLPRWSALVITATFFPVLAALGLGQIGPLLLAGLVGFLWFIETKPFLAGAFASLIAIKPQYLYLFWLALLAWCLKERQWKVVAGLLSALAIITIPVVLIDPRIFSEYVGLARSNLVFENPSPTIGTLLRMAFGYGHLWLQFVSSALGLAWCVVYWRRYAQMWSWADSLPLVIMISVITCSYGWLFDQVVLLPFIIKAAAALRETDRGTRYGLMLGYVFAQVLLAASVAWQLTGVAYAWAPFVWYLLYRLSIRRRTGVNVFAAASADLMRH